MVDRMPPHTESRTDLNIFQRKSNKRHQILIIKWKIQSLTIIFYICSLGFYNRTSPYGTIRQSFM